MKRVIKNVLRFLVVGSSTLFLAACYGVMTGFQYLKVTVLDETTDAAIPGLKVTLTEDGLDTYTATTDKVGVAGLYSYAEATGPITRRVTIEDTDGTANGRYAESTHDMTGTELSVSLTQQAE